MRRREYRERRRVLIIVHDRGGVLVRALCGAAVSMRGDWGLVHAGVRGRACGVKEYEWMGFKDSGMMGTSENDDPDCFWRQNYFDPVGKLVDS